MLIYEVNLEVDDDINFKVAAWLTEHINKMLTFKGFKVAQWFFRKPEDEGRPSEKKTLWTIQYLVEDRASLDEHLSQPLSSFTELIAVRVFMRFSTRVALNYRAIFARITLNVH